MFLGKLWNKISSIWKRDVNVYFISGMCYNCKVFDKLVLPKDYKKKYIEWLIPRLDESLTNYTKRMAQSIDTRHPFVLVGYSFGAVIVQDMNNFLLPQKTIIISSFKNESEIPTLFKFAGKTKTIEHTPIKFFSSTQFITNTFNKFVYDMPTSEIEEYMTVVDPIYIKWAAMQITNWIPKSKCSHLYHIHGTKDQIFTSEKIKNAYMVKDGDHLMVLKKADEVNRILAKILNKKNNNGRRL